MHYNLTILAEFYPDTLALIAKKYGFKIGEFRYQVMQNGVFLNQSDIELIDALVAEHYAAKRKIQGFAMSGKKYKSGDIIICVVVPYYGGFTVGKEYKVITTYAGKLGLLRLKDDNGNESKHLPQYFKLKD